LIGLFGGIFWHFWHFHFGTKKNAVLEFPKFAKKSIITNIFTLLPFLEHFRHNSLFAILFSKIFWDFKKWTF
jgi:hypothetical protein